MQILVLLESKRVERGLSLPPIERARGRGDDQNKTNKQKTARSRRESSLQRLENIRKKQK
jgi:hypothetical protein